MIGAAAGGAGGGLGVDEYEKKPTSKREFGAGIAAGAATGALIGTLLGHAICDPYEEEAPPPPPPPVVQAPPPPPPPSKGTKIATVGSANFDFDRASLKPSGRDVLDGAVKTMRDNPTLSVVIEGHTDSVGSDAYNERLSERRANAVKDYLVRQGISSSRITTRGYGESRPVASNDTEEGRAQNRRAEIIAD
ncbi:MAG TPA: OmpA family protein [Candidatus Binatia bacterium]|nr:OmpA family protein [Candidatus Binatia bacterium]